MTRKELQRDPPPPGGNGPTNLRPLLWEEFCRVIVLVMDRLVLALPKGEQ